MYLLFVFALIAKTALCARILGVFSLPWYSHFTQGETIFKELAARGHEVTVINSFPQKEKVKNYRDIVITELNESVENQRKDGTYFKFLTQSTITSLTSVHETFTKSTDISLQNENVQNLLRSNETFDLIILQLFMSEAYFGFMHRFKAPVVLVSTISPTLWTATPMGSPVPFAYMPNVYVSYSPNMNFWQRVHNSFVQTFQMLYWHFINLPKQNEILHKHFPDSPPIEDLIYNASVLLINHHSTTGAAVPLQPNMIEIGGFHVQKHRPLSASLQKFLDEATEGVVYFSMGSFLHSANLPKEKVAAILKAFSKLKMKVLWKWENDNLPGKPTNVRIEKWISQSAVLAHKNVRIFITHGGRLSITESIYFGKPIVGIPVFAEQGNNIREAAYLGYGVHLPFFDLSEESLLKSLREIIENPKYAETAKYRSNALRDLPISQLDNAIHWIEYTIKYKDLPHLKNASLKLRWYQLLLLDVILFWVVVLWILKKSICILFRRLSGITKQKLKTN